MLKSLVISFPLHYYSGVFFSENVTLVLVKLSVCCSGASLITPLLSVIILF